MLLIIYSYLGDISTRQPCHLVEFAVSGAQMFHELEGDHSMDVSILCLNQINPILELGVSVCYTFTLFGFILNTKDYFSLYPYTKLSKLMESRQTLLRHTADVLYNLFFHPQH